MLDSQIDRSNTQLPTYMVMLIHYNRNNAVGQSFFSFPRAILKNRPGSPGRDAPAANALLGWAVNQRIMIVPGNEHGAAQKYAVIPRLARLPRDDRNFFVFRGNRYGSVP